MQNENYNKISQNTTHYNFKGKTYMDWLSNLNIIVLQLKYNFNNNYLFTSYKNTSISIIQPNETHVINHHLLYF